MCDPGVPEPYKPKNRFDVIRWDYFTETLIYFQDDFTNVKPLKGKFSLFLCAVNISRHPCGQLHQYQATSGLDCLHLSSQKHLQDNFTNVKPLVD